MSYPNDLDNFNNPSATTKMDDMPHSEQHTNANNAIEALEAKVGINSSLDQDSIDWNIANNRADFDSHAESTSNPHTVTATQVGLGNCDNTSDANKPVSTAQQTELDNITSAFQSFHYRCNSGGARSVCSNVGTWVETPGWSNNTFTPTQDGLCFGNLIMMMNKATSGTFHCTLAINGESQQTVIGMMYVTAPGWFTQTLPFKFNVTANTSYELTSIWQVTTGTGDICNSSTDQQFPTEIMGIVIPRVA